MTAQDTHIAATEPPIAERRSFIRTHHGDTFDDPYEWLRDKNDPAVISYLEAENSYTEEQTRHLDGLREEIFTDIRSRTKETDLSVPSYTSHLPGPDGEAPAYWYYQRTIEGGEYPIFCRAPAADPQTPPDIAADIPGEEVLLDSNAEAGDNEFFSLGAFSVSPGGGLLAYAVDLMGNERYQLRLRNLVTGEQLPDVISDVAYGLAWAGDDQLFYTRADDAWRPFQIFRHALGTDSSTDPVIFAEPDERYWVSVGNSRDREWIVIHAGSKLTTEVRLLSSGDPTAEPRIVAPRRQGVEYEVEPAGDRLLILHNDGGAEDFALAQAPLDASSHEQWQTVLDHQPGVRLDEVDAYADFVVVGLRRNGLTGVHIIPRDGIGDLGEGWDIEFAEPLYTVGSFSGSEYATGLVRLSYTSLVTPGSVYDYRVADRELILRKITPVLAHPTKGAYRPEGYVQVRDWATAQDGTKIPISIVYAKDTPIDGSAPALIYGYGSYEASMDPSFQIARLSLLDRGFVYAIAHIRGGGEMGRAWYSGGRTTTKINTFTDFVDAARYLVSAGYTSADRLAARGASAGGLLMGAVANLAPDAFRAIHAGVPFVDPLTSILMPELPLTVTEWEEWGDPLHDPEIYAYMKSYSPYENVEAKDYPAILATTSLNDTRVLFTEPAKWIAALRHTATNGPDRPILLKTEMQAGHGGVSGRYQGWKETAFEFAWLIDQVS
ncbi:oligopeptidase B [Microlunatus endophyticus]|uniref:Oligopeptidase B n=1 Tax=Microlunatus endophyticus TaxID=1716077 RepID=A0A917S129_9ACTN|nr:S9 family peptidase [Microlunatus endophyticus]GGL51080.1 oligopeptidase B [Microlunatus endophyticus]